MEQTLLKIANVFQTKNITWALGASMLLHYHGLIEKPNDFDILIAPGDIHQAKTLLDSLGSRQTGGQTNPHYATRHFLEYQINDIDVDIMAGFTVVLQNIPYEYCLSPDHFNYQKLQNLAVPLCPLEDWYVLYALMPGRSAKSELIRNHLIRSGFNVCLLSDWLDKPLPDPVTDSIRQLLKKQ